jgi:hypothetical protein
MNMTGRRIAGPVSELVELESDDGILHTAIVFDEKYRGLPVLTQAIELARGFMEFPMVAGLVELSHFLPKDGAYVYPTGNARSLAEIIKYYRDTKSKFSKRAALELCYLAGLILQEASETGPTQGVWSHGDLNPARILVKDDGNVEIIGYGIPSPEVLSWADGGKEKPHPESLAYAPPERLQKSGEDVTSDLYSLACIATEVITHDALFKGDAEKLKKAHLNGEGPQLVSKVKRTIGPPIADIFTYCLNFDPRNRYADGTAFVEAVAEILEGMAGGDSLADAVAPVHARKAGRKLRAATPAAGVGQPTTGLRGAPAMGRAIRPQAEQQPSSAGRWGRVARGGEEEEPAAVEEEEVSTSRRRRRRRRETKEEPVEAKPAKPSRRRRAAKAEKAKEEPAEEVSTSSRRRRRRRKTEEEPEAKAEAPAEEEVKTSRRRRRRKTEEEPEAKAEAPAKKPAAKKPASSRARRRKPKEEEEKPAEVATSSRRRRRRKTDEAEEKAEEPAKEATSSRRRRPKKDEPEEEKPSPRRRRRRT